MKIIRETMVQRNYDKAGDLTCDKGTNLLGVGGYTQLGGCKGKEYKSRVPL